MTTPPTGPMRQSARDRRWVPAVGLERDLFEIIERKVHWDSDIDFDADVYLTGIESAARAIADYLRARGYQA